MIPALRTLLEALLVEGEDVDDALDHDPFGARTARTREALAALDVAGALAALDVVGELVARERLRESGEVFRG